MSWVRADAEAQERAAGRTSRFVLARCVRMVRRLRRDRSASPAVPVLGGPLLVERRRAPVQEPLSWPAEYRTCRKTDTRAGCQMHIGDSAQSLLLLTSASLEGPR